MYSHLHSEAPGSWSRHQRLCVFQLLHLHLLLLLLGPCHYTTRHPVLKAGRQMSNKKKFGGFRFSRAFLSVPHRSVCTLLPCGQTDLLAEVLPAAELEALNHPSAPLPPDLPLCSFNPVCLCL